MGSAITAVGAVIVSPPASSTRTSPSPWTTRVTCELRRMSASVACPTMPSSSSRVPFTSFVAVRAADACSALQLDRA